MDVELFYFEGCPNWTVADEHLAQALAVTGRGDVAVQRHCIETLAEAEAVGFTGSPTIHVNGRDLFATGDEQVGLACRVYPTPEGLRGAPTVQQFVGVLSRGVAERGFLPASSKFSPGQSVRPCRR